LNQPYGVIAAWLKGAAPIPFDVRDRMLQLIAEWEMFVRSIGN